MATHFLGFFVPKGVPAAMLPLVVVIEVISYFMRPISHSVRLFANMTAGHTMLKVFGGFVVKMGVFGVLPFALIVALTGLELADRRFASLRFHNPDLPLSERCDTSGALIGQQRFFDIHPLSGNF